jgi:hypothetical protein
MALNFGKFGFKIKIFKGRLCLSTDLWTGKYPVHFLSSLVMHEGQLIKKVPRYIEGYLLFFSGNSGRVT